ncbi:hypothetical protein FQN60_008501 [Etheostoma spectabile]|uniref:Uncharacterized protein n=1 Tax=Etheostoma spectabile TaxID=54343 RepID=A0A5J5CVM1_9PERO|nr:hypothetical protein FQN60_008501 [Etheostoma spectabile]
MTEEWTPSLQDQLPPPRSVGRPTAHLLIPDSPEENPEETVAAGESGRRARGSVVVVVCGDVMGSIGGLGNVPCQGPAVVA